MAVPRPLPFLLSVLLALGLWVYGAFRLQTKGGIQGVYATLVCGDTYTDREIRGILDGRGLTGLVSESDQWFLLDSFGYIEKIPLVEYEERLLPFDPRNDGYAEKLRALFVRDGKRFIYIPLAVNAPESLETKIAGALAGIPYSLEYARSSGRSVIFPFMFFCLAACAFFVMKPLRRLLDINLLPCLPALSPLALGTAPGFALAALLAGFASLFAEPGKQRPGLSGLGRGYAAPEPFAARRLPAFAFIACYMFLSLFSGIPFFFTFIVFVSFCCVLALSNMSHARSDGGSAGSGGAGSGGGVFSKKAHFKIIDSARWSPKSHRFTPVEILSRKTVTYNFFPVMLPFSLMALALAIAGFAKPQSLPAPPVKPPPLPQGLVSEADFKEHFFRQYTFSFIALGKPDEEGAAVSGGLPSGRLPAIAGYELSSNGLLVPAAPGIDGEPPEVPDFPLGELLRGLSSNSPRQAAPEKRGNPAPADLLLSLPPFFFILPAYICQKRVKKHGGNTSGFAGFFR